VIPVWEEVRSEDVAVLKDVMATRKTAAGGVELYHTRIPITAERPPDFSDLSELIDVVVRTDSSNTPIVINCQLGRGRSTLTSVRSIHFYRSLHTTVVLTKAIQVIILLIQQWLETSRLIMTPSTPRKQIRTMSGVSLMSFSSMERSAVTAKRHSYQIINSEC
jgi:protein-tyrosine phosphatase